jgi:hypothetical protein
MRFILFVFTFSSNFDYHCTATPRDIQQQHVGKRKTQSSRLGSMNLPEEEESAWQARLPLRNMAKMLSSNALKTR